MAINLDQFLPQQPEPPASAGLAADAATKSVAATAGPAKAPPGTPLDPYTQARLDELAPKPPEIPKGRYPQSVPYQQNRAAIEQGHEDNWAGLGPVANLPRKDKLAYVSQFLETPSVNVSGLAEAPLSSAYQLSKLAEQEGYKVVFQSGARNKGGDSYHDHGEAVDVRFLRKSGDGSTHELTPRENVELGKRLGKASGWASALDEFHYWSNGTIKNDTWNNAPHVHLAYGNERNLSSHPMHTELNKRHWSDPDYLKQPVFGAKGPVAPARSDRTNIPGLVEVISKANGLDSDIAANWINAESGFNPKAVSPVGAMGLPQMMPETLKEVAPKVGITVEQYHNSPAAQIKAGVYYLKQQLKANNGNYARALAAYNAGPGGLQKIIDGHDIQETSDYVYKIMKESDPTITSAAAATEAIRKGTGRVRDVEADKQLVKDTLHSAKQEVSSIYTSLLGQDLGINAKAAVDTVADTLNPTTGWDDPLSGKRRAVGFLNEMLNDATFGIAPLSGWAKESSEKGDEFLSQEAQDGAFSVGNLGKQSTRWGIGIARTLAGAMTGGIVARAARVLPVVGKIIQEGDAVAKLGAAIPEGAGGIAANVKNLLSGGPLAIFKANLGEQIASGVGIGGTFAASDYFWNNPDGAEGLDFLKGMVTHGLTGGYHGGLMGAAAAVGIPLFGSVGLTTLNRVTGIGSANMADNAANLLAQQFGKLNATQRTLAGGFGGGIVGAGGGAVADVTGLTQMMTGEDPGLTDSMLTGAQYLGGLGAAAGAGYNKLGGLIDRAATSSFMQSKAAKSVMDPIREWVGKQNEQAVRVMSQQYIDDMNRNLAWQKQSSSHANAFVHAANLGDRVKQLEGTLAERGQVRDNLKGEVMKSEQAGKDLLGLQSQLDARYPAAAAFDTAKMTKQAEIFELSEKAKTSKGKTAQALGMKVEVAKKEFQDLLASATKDKDLSVQMNGLARDRVALNSRLAGWQKKHGELSSALADQEAVVAGIQDVHSIHTQMKSHLEDLMTKGATPDQLENIQYALQLEGPWNKKPSADPRARLSAAAEKATQEEEYSNLLSRQSQFVIKNGKGPMTDLELQTHQAVRGQMAGTAEEFRGTMQSRIQSIKDNLAKLESGKTVHEYHGTPKSFRDWKASNDGPLTDWATDIPKGHAVAVVDAMALRRGILDRLEAGGTAVDHATLYQEAGVRASARFVEAKAKLPVYDESNLIELAKDAESMLRQGETKFPVLVNSSNKKALQELAAEGGAAHLTSAKAEAEAMVRDLEGTIGAQELPVGYVGPLMSEGGTKPVGGKPIAEGAVLDDVLKTGPEAWGNISSRVGAIEKAVKEKLGIHGDIEAYQNFLETGNIDLTNNPELIAWTKSGGDIASAPPAVQAWSEAVTLARTEEVKRLRQLEGLITGKDEEGLILGSLREAQAAGYEPPAHGSVPKSVFGELDSTLKHDSNTTVQTSKAISELMAGDNPTLWNKILPIAQNAYHDHIYSRLGAVREILTGILHPEFNKIEAELSSTMVKKGLNWKDIKGPEVTAFYKEFAEAVEDTGKLIKFRENYPEADKMVNFYYGMQQRMEAMVAASPHLKPWVQANYLPHRFRKLASHLAAASPEERISLAKGLEEGRYKTLADAETAVAAVSKDVLDAGFSSTDEFINMSPSERAKRMEFHKVADMDQQWKDLKPQEQEAYIKKSQDKVMTLLMQDPVTHPMELIEMQMGSLFRADSQRHFLEGLSRMPTLTDDKGNTQMMVMGSKGPGAFTARNESGKLEPYGRLSEAPGFHGASLEIDGVTHKARDLHIHPEAFRFLRDFSAGSGYSKNTAVRAVQRLQSIFRNTVLMGSFLPHQMQTLGSHMMEFVGSPVKMMKLAVGGGNLGGGREYSQAALRANAVRSGLNIRTLERSASHMAKNVLDEFGPEISARLYGIEDKGYMKFLQSLDPGDPMAPEAKKLMGANAQKVSDILGLPAHMDYSVNRELLFRPIEMGQLAGFHMRAQRYLSEAIANGTNKHLPPEEQMRMAMKEAAMQTNKLSGALPHILQSNTIRQAAHATLLTPTWFASKATTIADSLDSLIYMAKKKATGKGWSPLEAMGRQSFDYLPPTMRDATRARMAKTITAGLAGSLAMLETAQYFADGTSIFDHPPDKWFHIRVGEEYYTGPVHGYVRDLFRFVSNFASSDGYSLSPSLESAKEAAVNLITRQLNPSLEDMTKFLFQTRKGEVLEAPDTVANWVGSVAQTLAAQPLEVLGVDSKQFKGANTPGYFNLGTPEQKEGAKSTMLKAKHYLLRQAGAYATPDNLDMQIRGHFYDRNKELESRHRGLIQPLLRKARTAESPEEQNRWLSAAADAFYQGVPVRDKLMKDYYPEGIYRLSDKEYESMQLEELNPAAKSMKGIGNTPVGMMVAQARAESGRQ